MNMSRPELDGHLAALSQLNGNKPGKKENAPARQTFKSLRRKRKKGRKKDGR